MPNHARTKLSIDGDKADIDAIIDLMKGEKTAFDLGKVKPMPSALDGIHTGSTTIDGVLVHQWREVAGKAVAIPDDEMARLEAEHGTTNWYDWCVEHWGTKWNAYDVKDWRRDEYGASINFNTAWCDPRPIFDALAAKFPRVNFQIRCDGEVDEPYGYRINATEE